MAQGFKMRGGMRTCHRGVCATLCLALSAGAAGQQATSPAASRNADGARKAYSAGARALQRNDAAAAQREFARALELDPQNKEYGVALEVARQHEVTTKVQQASRARLLGDRAQADALLAEARALDPENPLVLEHSAAPRAAAQSPVAASAGSAAGALTHQEQLLDTSAIQGWRLPPPVIAGAIHLKPSAEAKDLHLRGDSQEVVRQIAAAFGIRAVMDDSAEHKPMRFDMDHATYETAMPTAMSMAHVFDVALDENSAIFAKDDTPNRQRLEPLLEETIYLPAMTPEQINDIVTLVRQVFGISRASVETTLGALVVRAPESVLDPMNATLHELIDSNSEIVLDVKLYETSITRSRNIGATIPTQAGIYSVDAAAQQLVQNNQSLVQQAIAQGYISATASNLQIALALIASGLVQSSLLSSTIGFFGNGLTLTGVTETGSLGVNLSLNESDTRALDDVEMRLGDRQVGTFRSGTRYPILSSTYTSGVSTAASSLSNASINGVSVASLLSQFSGGSSVTIPQVQYEDLGLTLKATPTIQRGGRISLTVDMKVEALAGGSLDGIPVLGSRQFASNISIGDGETAVLVSNLNRTETAAVTGLPGLSELPGFQVPLDKNAERDTSQLVVLMTPHVVLRRMNPFVGPAIRLRLAAGGEGGGVFEQPAPQLPPVALPPGPAPQPPTGPGAQQPGAPGQPQPAIPAQPVPSTTAPATPQTPTPPGH